MMKGYYRAFGLKIASEIPLTLPEEKAEGRADVEIRRDRVDFASETDGIRVDAGSARFLICDGWNIRVDAKDDVPDALLEVYLLGSCMGAVQYQRGGLLLHGSCVAREGKCILLTGNSGVGKSTLAREFLSRGWQLLTDDVASVLRREGRYFVQPSYPSQKLWKDAMARYDLQGKKLFQQEREEKFSVNASAYFCPEQKELKGIVRLCVGDAFRVDPVEGIIRVDQVMRNMYRSSMIPSDEWENYFQRCVDLADEVPFFLGIRTEADDASKTLCSMLEAMDI